MESLDKPVYENEKTKSEKYLKIYSSRVIWGFSIFFSAIFGAVLLMQNLLDIGKKKEAYYILTGSILYTLIIIYIVNLSDKPNNSYTFLFNAIGGLVLTKTYFKKYFPFETGYGKKKIWKPLIISVIISIPLVYAALHNIHK